MLRLCEDTASFSLIHCVLARDCQQEQIDRFQVTGQTSKTQPLRSAPSPSTSQNQREERDGLRVGRHIQHYYLKDQQRRQIWAFDCATTITAELRRKISWSKTHIFQKFTFVAIGYFSNNQIKVYWSCVQDTGCKQYSEMLPSKLSSTQVSRLTFSTGGTSDTNFFS